MQSGRMRPDLYPELFRVEDNHWWHQQKRRVIHQLIRRYHPKTGKVLDVGCGAGKILWELSQNEWQAEGVDFHISQGKKRQLKLVKTDLEHQPLPYPANRFDLTICLDTLEHIDDDRRLVRELLRVTKSGGHIIISVPAYQWLFSYWDSMLGHFRRYTAGSLLKAVPVKSVKIRLISYFFSFLLLPAALIRLMKIFFRQKHQSDFQTDPLPVLTHGLVGFFGHLELLWLKRFKIPLGLSLVCVLEKK